MKKKIVPLSSSELLVLGNNAKKSSSTDSTIGDGTNTKGRPENLVQSEPEFKFRKTNIVCG